MRRFALYTEDGELREYHSLKEAINDARYLMWLRQVHSVVVDEVNHEVVFRI